MFTENEIFKISIWLFSAGRDDSTSCQVVQRRELDQEENAEDAERLRRKNRSPPKKNQ